MPSTNEHDTKVSTIADVLGVDCPECGQRQGLSVRVCACGASLRSDESDSEVESLSFLHSEGLENVPDASKGSHKLRRLRLALDGIRSGELALDSYREVVGQVLQETRAMQDLLKLEALKQVEADLPPEAVDVLHETADNVDSFAQACERMLLYDGQNIMLADEGFQMAESTIGEMLATQKEAAELQAEYRSN